MAGVGLGEETPRSFCCGLFRALLGGSAAGTAGWTPHRDDGFEHAIVIGSGRRDVVGRRLERTLGGEFLEPGLVVLATGSLGSGGDVVDHEVEDHFGRSVPAGVDEDGTEDGFECVGEDGLFVPPAGLVFTPAEEQLGSDTDASSHDRKGGGVDHRRPQLGQLTFGQVVVGAVDVFGDGQAEYGIAKELEPFIRLGCVGLRTVASVGERQLQQCGVSELVPDGSGQFLGVGRLVQESAPTWLKT